MKKLRLPNTSGEAISQSKRYFENAKETLRKTPIEYGLYKDEKHVKKACAMAYIAALRAIDAYLLSNGTSPQKLPSSIVEYEKALLKVPHNGKLMASMTVVYQNLHILGYYRSGVDVEMIKSGFKHAKTIIDTFAKLYEK